MDKVTECLDALIEEMRESRAYQNYLWMEEELEKDPDLKSRVDDYRIRNYRLQQSENVDLLRCGRFPGAGFLRTPQKREGKRLS